MSRIKELKEKYPHLNLSFFDIMTRLDVSHTNKYLPLFCKIFSTRFDVNVQYGVDKEASIKDLNHRLSSSGLSTLNLTSNQIYTLTHLVDYFNHDWLNSLIEFMDFMERGKIENKDISKYESLDDVRSAITLASMKDWVKDMEGEVIKEFEDNKWVIVRPLTFAASAKYGAATRWCTTSYKEKSYFEKYWRRGILVYFLNKVTGYKFAGYKSLDGDNELSFWNAEDQRVDFIQLEIDDYLFTIVKKIFQSTETNKNLCSSEIQEQVHSECLNYHEKLRAVDLDENEVQGLRDLLRVPININEIVQEPNWVSNNTATYTIPEPTTVTT